MRINYADNESIDTFISESIAFLKTKVTNKHYAEGSSANAIRLLDGTVIPATDEAIFVLDNEFEAFIVDQLVKYAELLIENIDSKLFGLTERTLYEYITGWLFLTVSGHLDDRQVDRMKALLFAGFYRYVSSSDTDYIKYMSKRGNFLTPKDLTKLEELNYGEFNDYIWSVLNGIVSGYPLARKGTIDKLGGATFYKHQSMRIHANPTALAELTSDVERNDRHRLIIAFNLRQAIEYYKGQKEADRLVYKFDKFWKNNKISLE